MKTIINNILSRKTTFILIMFEIVFSIIYFICVVTEIYSAFINNIEIPKTFSCDTDQILQAEIGMDSVADKNKEGQDPNTPYNIFKTLKNNDKIDACSSISFSDKYESELSDMFMFIDEDSSNFKELSISNGRTFQNDDFNENKINESKTIPILCGEQVAKKNNLSVGDLVKCDESLDSSCENYKIIGILSSNQKMVDELFFAISGINYPFYDLDYTVVLPTLDCYRQRSPIRFFYVKYHNQNDVEEIQEYIKSEYDKMHYDIGTIKISNVLDDIYKETIEDNQYWLYISLIILILNIICVSIIISSMVYSRKYEIGIRLCVGYSKKHIIRMLSSEIVFVSAISYILIYLFLKFLTTAYTDAIIELVSYTSWQIILLSIGITLIFCIISVLMIIIKFRNIQPKDMIGGQE